jgi:hypothetical protein
MPAINKLPLGLLGFLGIKNGGRYPQDIADVLAPTWDMRELYTYGNSEIDNVLVALNALGSQTYTTVPNGEAWLVLQQAAASDTLTAGQTIEFVTNWTDAASLVNIETSDATGSRTVGARAVAVCSRPYLAGPGQKIGVTVLQLAAGPVNVRLRTRFARFTL